MPRTADECYAALIGRYRDGYLLGSCAELLGWDEQTYMPRNGSKHRGEQMALLARVRHEWLTAPEMGELLAEVEASSLVSEPGTAETVNVREIRRAYDRAVKLPKSLVEELARVTTAAQQAWRDARKASDFAAFRPHLQRIVDLKRQQASAIGFTTEPYDALLDEFEPGFTASEVTAVFDALRPGLVQLVGAIAASGKSPKRDILEREYPVDQQALFAQSAAAAIGFDFDAGRLDVTVHPFCCTIGPGDCRITTRYNPRHINEAFFGVLHEAGHGMYEQGLDPKYAGTPVGMALSLGIHESQSRLWENQVGRGRPFWQHFFPRAKQTFLTALRDVTLDDWMFAINDVRPSMIRVEADEATYNLHILLRFELERALLTGDLQVHDVPGAWNERFAAMFGLEVPSDAQGCLQDVHWSFGGLGYFPTYTLGNLISAQLMQTARRELSGLDQDFSRGEFGRLKGWLNEKVHRPGGRYRAQTLCREITGESLNHEPLLTYLHEKYASLYSL